jgi:hypothetical protein
LNKQNRDGNITWSWEGDTFALRGFNVAITPYGGNPNSESIAKARVEASSRSYTFENITINADGEYQGWVQAIYEGGDSAWQTTGKITVPDDGTPTIVSSTDVDTIADETEQNAKEYFDSRYIKDNDELIHFDKHLTSTKGLEPEAGYEVTIREDGKHDGAVAIEESTENLSNGISGTSGISLTYISDENGWKKYSLSGTWNSGTYPYCMRLKGVSLKANTAYSTSFYFKTNAQHKFHSEIRSVNYVNMSLVTTGNFSVEKLHNDIFFVKREGFIYPKDTTQSGYLSIRPKENGTTFNPNTDFVYFKKVQVEKSIFSTSFTESTRDKGKLNYPINTDNKTINFYRKGVTSLVENTNEDFSKGILTDVEVVGDGVELLKPTFEDDFLNSNNWTGNFDIDNGYLRHTADNISAYTINNVIESGKKTINFKFMNNGHGSSQDQYYVSPIWNSDDDRLTFYMRTYKSGDYEIELLSLIGGASTSLFSDTKYNYYNMAGQWFNIKMFKDSSDIKVKIWIEGDSEPENWDWEVSAPEGVVDEGKFHSFARYTDVNGTGLDNIYIEQYKKSGTRQSPQLNLSDINNVTDSLIEWEGNYIEEENFGDSMGGSYHGNNGLIYFDVHRRMRLDSVLIDANFTGDVVITLQDGSGGYIKDKTINISTSGEQRIDIGWVLEPGSYRIGRVTNTSATPLRRIPGAATFPYESKYNIATMTGTNAADYYYYFFDWHITDLSSLKVETSVDNGSSWQLCENGGSVPNLPTSPTTLDVRLKLSTGATTITPTLSEVKAYIFTDSDDEYKMYTIKPDGTAYLNGNQINAVPNAVIDITEPGKLQFKPNNIYDEVLIKDGDVTEEEINNWYELGTPFVDLHPKTNTNTPTNVVLTEV